MDTMGTSSTVSHLLVTACLLLPCLCCPKCPGVKLCSSTPQGDELMKIVFDKACGFFYNNGIIFMIYHSKSPQNDIVTPQNNTKLQIKPIQSFTCIYPIRLVMRKSMVDVTTPTPRASLLHVGWRRRAGCVTHRDCLQRKMVIALF